MSAQPGGEGGMTMRSRALVLKSISIFLGKGRNVKSTPKTNTKSAKKKRKVMSDRNGENKISGKLLEAIKRDTYFTREEIEKLHKIYRKLVMVDNVVSGGRKMQDSSGVLVSGKSSKSQEGVKKMVFCELLHNTFDIITEDTLFERYFNVVDKQNAGFITLRDWFKGLSIILKGTFVDHLNFCFSVYDLNGDGYITKDEVYLLLRNCLIQHPQDDDSDEGVKDLVEIVIRKFDKDGDGKISMEDYKETVTAEPLLLEAFGTCLPSDRARATFLATLTVA